MNGVKYSTLEIRRRAVAALEQGVPLTKVAKAYGVDRTTLYRWKVRYAKKGDAGLARAPVPGRPRKIAEVDGKALKHLVLTPASAYGYETDFWTTRRLIQVLEGDFEVRLSKQSMMRRLRAAGLTFQKPERKYFELSEKERRAWLRNQVPKICATVRRHKAILYFQDEANVSLTPLLGKTWAPRGQTPQQRVTGNRGGISAMSALSNRGHLLFRLHDKRIATGEVIDFLAQMLRHHPRRHLVVVMDNAPPHVSRATRAFIESQSRLHVFPLPAYSPDWNPDEKVWNHLKHQELKGHQARTKAELKELTLRKLNGMGNNKQLLEGIFFRCCISNLFESC